MKLNERLIRNLCADVTEGYQTAAKALGVIVAMHNVVRIGTARSVPVYAPRILTNSVHGNDPNRRGDDIDVDWNADVVTLPHNGMAVASPQ